MGPQGIQGPKGDPAPVVTPNFLRIYGSLDLRPIVYNSNDVVRFDNIGEISGTAIRYTLESNIITLEGGRAYYASFEGAADFEEDVAGTSLGMALNGVSIAGSGISCSINRVPNQNVSDSMTSVAIFTTPPNRISTLEVSFGGTDPVHLIGPILNIMTIG